MDSRSKNALRIVSIIKNKPMIGPRTILLALTNKCNIVCKYCWEHSPYDKSKKKLYELDLDRVLKLIDEAADFGVERIFLSGDGEPLYYQGIEKVIKRIRERGLNYSLNTNATFSDKKFLL